MKHLGMLFLVAYALSGGVADAATYYVAKSGSNNYSCAQAQSVSTPRLTIVAGIACLTAGDTLMVRAGDYDEGIASTPSGTSWTNKVRITNYSGEKVWLKPAVHLVGNPGACVNYNAGSEHYVEWDGINMDCRNTGYNGIVLHVDEWGEPHHVRFQNAEVIGTYDNHAYAAWGASAIDVHGGRPTLIGGFEFINLKVSGGGRPGTTNPDNGYGIYLAVPNSLIENCDIFDNKGAGIHVYNDDGGAPDNNIIRNNRVHDESRNSMPGQMWAIIISGSNNQVYNNVVYRVRSGSSGDAIYIYRGSGNSIMYNTIYDNAGRGIALESGTNSNVVRNNISYKNAAGNYVNGGSGTVHDHNVDAGADPLFSTPATDDFTLQSGSPARNTGVTVSQVTKDAAGTARPQEGTPDIGAYEYGGVAPTPPATPPATPSNYKIVAK